MNLRVTQNDGRPAEDKTYKSPRKEMGRDKEHACCSEHEEEQGGGEGLIRKICERSDGFQDRIVNDAKIIHTVLQIPHVAEEIF